MNLKLRRYVSVCFICFSIIVVMQETVACKTDQLIGQSQMDVACRISQSESNSFATIQSTPVLVCWNTCTSTQHLCFHSSTTTLLHQVVRRHIIERFLILLFMHALHIEDKFHFQGIMIKNLSC